MKLVLYAVGTQHASELLESVHRLGHEVAACVRNVPEHPAPAELADVLEVDDVDAELRALPFAVPQTSPQARRAAVDDARARGFSELVTIVDPTAIVAASARLGGGTYVGAGAVVGAGSVCGEGCLVNRSGSIAHHVTLGDYVTTGPAVVVAGACRIEDGSFLGAGAVLAPGVRVGTEVVVGAGAVVIRDVPPGETVVGNPARPV